MLSQNFEIFLFLSKDVASKFIASPTTAPHTYQHYILWNHSIFSIWHVKRCTDIIVIKDLTCVLKFIFLKNTGIGLLNANVKIISSFRFILHFLLIFSIPFLINTCPSLPLQYCTKFIFSRKLI